MEQGKLDVELALPLKGWLFVHPVTDWHSSLNQGVRCYRELYVPLSPDKTGAISLFLTEEWLVWYYCVGQDVPGLRISPTCNLYASHLL